MPTVCQQLKSLSLIHKEFQELLSSPCLVFRTPVCSFDPELSKKTLSRTRSCMLLPRRLASIAAFSAFLKAFFFCFLPFTDDQWMNPAYTFPVLKEELAQTVLQMKRSKFYKIFYKISKNSGDVWRHTNQQSAKRTDHSTTRQDTKLR